MTHIVPQPTTTRWRGDLLELEGPERAQIVRDRVIEVDTEGTIYSIRAYRAGESIDHDHRDKLIAPGFVDAHVHLSLIHI